MTCWQRINYLLTRPEVDPNRIGLVGKSMGGAAGGAGRRRSCPIWPCWCWRVPIVAFEENLPRIVGLTRAPGFLAARVLNQMETESGVLLMEINSLQTVSDLNVPLLVIHGERDQLVPVAQGEAIFAAANEPKMLYTIPQAGHLNIFTVDPETFTEQMRSFLAAHLQ